MTDPEPPGTTPSGPLSGPAGELAVAVAQAHGVETTSTLSGAHVFPLYDGAVEAAESRAFASGVPYLVNMITDVEAVYPRTTFGV